MAKRLAQHDGILDRLTGALSQVLQHRMSGGVTRRSVQFFTGSRSQSTHVFQVSIFASSSLTGGQARTKRSRSSAGSPNVFHPLFQHGHAVAVQAQRIGRCQPADAAARD